jgi:hypothetical protein
LDGAIFGINSTIKSIPAKGGDGVQAVRPTLKQKRMLKKRGLNPQNWLVTRRQPPGTLRVVHKESKTVREIAI